MKIASIKRENEVLLIHFFNTIYSIYVLKFSNCKIKCIIQGITFMRQWLEYFIETHFYRSLKKTSQKLLHGFKMFSSKLKGIPFPKQKLKYD